MAERERQRAAGGDVELLVVAEREIAVLQMQVGMAHAAALDAHEHFVAARRRAVDDGFAERFAVGDERLAAHLSWWCPPASWPAPALNPAALRASATKAVDRNVLGPRGRVDAGRREQCQSCRRRATSGFGAASCGAGRRRPRSRARALARSQASGAARGDEPHHRRGHLRRRHEGRRRDVEQDASPRVRQRASTDSRP